jgi:hypothetical protein
MNPGNAQSEQKKDAIARLEKPVAGFNAAALPAAPVCPAEANSQSDGFSAGRALSAAPAGGLGGRGAGGPVESALCAGGGAAPDAGAAIWPNGTNTGEVTGPAAGAAGTVNGFPQAGQLICVPL